MTFLLGIIDCNYKITKFVDNDNDNYNDNNFKKLKVLELFYQ